MKHRLCPLFISISIVIFMAMSLGSVLSAVEPPAPDDRPCVTGTCLVAPDVLAITIAARSVIPGSVVDYAPVAGDEVASAPGEGGQAIVTLTRGGAAIGELVGSGAKRQLITTARVRGEALRTEAADQAANYTVSSSDDPVYAHGLMPRAVHRKSKPIDYDPAHPPARHVVFLRLPHPLVEGRSYRIDCAALGLQQQRIDLRNDTRTTRSLAVHTSQIGYRVDDPVKRGYLSIWLGPSAGAPGSGPGGGAFSYPEGLTFHLLDDASGAVVFTGAVEMAKRASEPESPVQKMNFNGTNVLRMDFSAFAQPGRYRVHVAGIGCGYPFAIDDGSATWEHAFLVQMRGFFHQRSGIALGPPFTTFVKPRDHHPDDGVEIMRSAHAAGIWADQPGDEKHLQRSLREQATSERATDAWGGYHDAGDWNPRRITHLRATMAMLEIADLFPAFAARLRLDIPQDRPVPDLFNEALFEIDCFRRMQTSDGGIGYGLETVGDPVGATVSWHTRMQPVYQAAPDAGSSWIYAAAAARAARLLRPHDAAVAAIYAESATKAMTWAEAEFARQAAASKRTTANLQWTARDHRNLAALEMLRLTRDRRWHDVFREDTVITRDHPALFDWLKASQSDAAFAYAIADATLTDAVVRARAIQGLVLLADAARTFADGNAFDIASDNPYRPHCFGFYSLPNCGHVALRAYHVTGDARHLATGVCACQFSSGANPDNLVFTTGLGANPIRNPLKLDARISGQAAPAGITVYGIEDHVNHPGTWSYWILPMIDSVMHPGYRTWPVTESYTDTYLFIPVNEFTTDIWFESVWTWGYLAARPPVR